MLAPPSKGPCIMIFTKLNTSCNLIYMTYPPYLLSDKIISIIYDKYLFIVDITTSISIHTNAYLLWNLVISLDLLCPGLGSKWIPLKLRSLLIFLFLLLLTNFRNYKETQIYYDGLLSTMQRLLRVSCDYLKLVSHSFGTNNFNILSIN